MELVLGGSYQGKLEYVQMLTGYTTDHVYDASSFDDSIKNIMLMHNSKSGINEDGNSKASDYDITTLDDKTLIEKTLIDKALIDEIMIDEVLKKPILNHFHLLIKGLLDLDIDPYPVVNTILSLQKDIIIISDDIGSGIVPLLASDRKYRETLGRILCQLAQEAMRVHRVILGIGTIIK
jgi:adenosyl cobinamide kinase/adenosyl cobinamide phosphate guanylyltransferase